MTKPTLPPLPEPSPALERVIAEQQKEIDRLKQWHEKNDDRWIKNHKQVARLVSAAFSVLDEPGGSPECHFELKQAIISMGYCVTCECAPCECDGQYD